MEPNINSALARGFFQQIRYLIEFGQDVNHRDAERRTPLMNCALVEDAPWGVGLARLFLEKGAAIGHRDKRGLNALHYACIYGRAELARLLLRSMDFDLRQGDRLGNTALHYAAGAGEVALVKLLIDTHTRYKISVDKPNKRGATPLLLAWRNAHVTCARMLTELAEANGDVIDPGERKCAKDYENELVGSRESSPDDDLEVTYVNQENRRPSRPKSAVSHHSNRGSKVNRPRSAYNLGARVRVRVRSASLQSASSLTSLKRSKVQRTMYGQEVEEEEEMFEKENLATRTIRSAAANELRNKPDYIFQVTPAECFVNQGDRMSHVLHRPRRCHSATVRQGDTDNTATWRAGMGGLYKNYDFQFTQSFRKGAIPPDPEVMRPGSPSPSDCASEAVSDRAGSAQGKKLTRKQSMSNMAKLLPGEKGKKKASGRRGSVVTMTEGSSNESINSIVKTKRRQSMDHDDSSDVSSCVSNVTKEKQKEKTKSPRKDQSDSRPASRTGHHQGGGAKETRSMHVIKE